MQRCHSSEVSKTVIDMLISSDTVQCSTFSPEIIAEIIGYLHDDKETLLTLGLVSKYTLYESRHHLFSNVYFSGPSIESDAWEDFDRFLRLVDVAWTSFTPTIQCIGFERAYMRSDDDDSAGRNIPLARIRVNLPNVKSLRLLSIKCNGVPSYILDLVFQLPIEHLSLDWAYGFNATGLLNLFRRFPPSLRTLDFKGLRSTMMPDFSEEPSTFHRPLRFKTLDSQSILPFKRVWDPSICHNLDIEVKSFHLQPPYDHFWLHQREAPFISRFLQHIGPSLENLIISLADYSRPCDSGINGLLDPINVSQCINLRSLEIGEIKLEDRAPDSVNMADVIRKFLTALPSPKDLQEICITVKPIAPTLEDHLAVLKSFKWSSFIETVQRLLPNLQKLVIHIATRELQDFNPFLSILRRVSNLKELEEKGVIKLHAFSLRHKFLIGGAVSLDERDHKSCIYNTLKKRGDHLC